MFIKMKVLLFIVSTILLATLAGCGSGTQSSETRVAILMPLTHPSFDRIEKGFKQTLQDSFAKPIQFTTFNGQGSKTLLRSEIDEVARQNYDLVFTIGIQSSCMTKEVFQKKGLETPIVFTTIALPEVLGLADRSTNRTITGIQEILDFETLLSALPILNANMRNVLLVYDPTNFGLKEDRETVEKILSGMNIKLTPVEVFRTSEIQQKAMSFIAGADAVFILKDNTVVSGVDTLVKLCDRAGIPLLASDLDSVDKGAALAYGVNEDAYGTEAAKVALEILTTGTSPEAIPVRPLPTTMMQFKIHRPTLAKLKISAEAIRSLGVQP